MWYRRSDLQTQETEWKIATTSFQEVCEHRPVQAGTLRMNSAKANNSHTTCGASVACRRPRAFLRPRLRMRIAPLLTYSGGRQGSRQSGSHGGHGWSYKRSGRVVAELGNGVNLAHAKNSTKAERGRPELDSELPTGNGKG